MSFWKLVYELKMGPRRELFLQKGAQGTKEKAGDKEGFTGWDWACFEKTDSKIEFIG